MRMGLIGFHGNGAILGFAEYERKIKLAGMVVMILQLSCLTHAESILGIWLKANAPGPLGDWTSICMKP